MTQSTATMLHFKRSYLLVAFVCTVLYFGLPVGRASELGCEQKLTTFSTPGLSAQISSCTKARSRGPSGQQGSLELENGAVVSSAHYCNQHRYQPLQTSLERLHPQLPSPSGDGVERANGPGQTGGLVGGRYTHVENLKGGRLASEHSPRTR